MPYITLCQWRRYVNGDVETQMVDCNIENAIEELKHYEMKYEAVLSGNQYKRFGGDCAPLSKIYLLWVRKAKSVTPMSFFHSTALALYAQTITLTQVLSSADKSRKRSRLVTYECFTPRDISTAVRAFLVSAAWHSIIYQYSCTQWYYHLILALSCTF